MTPEVLAAIKARSEMARVGGFHENLEVQRQLVYYDLPALLSYIGMLQAQVDGLAAARLEAIEREVARTTPGTLQTPTKL